MSSEIPASGRLAVVSPHLDDAALGCGELIAAHPGAAVITVFAGRPRRYPEVTSWDARAGFGPSDDVVAVRREEDRAGLAHLGARPIWLDFPDPQYGETPAVEAVAEALAVALRAVPADTIAIPLGLFHDDHQLASDAAMQVVNTRVEVRWLAYADAIYRRVPNLLDERLRAFRAGGVTVDPAGTSSGPASDLKRRAVSCYGSQLRALAVSWDGGHADAFAPEQYWRLGVGAPTVVGGHPGGASDDR